MMCKRQLLSLAVLMLVLFSACKKDIITSEQEGTVLESVSSNAAADDVVETAPPVYTSVVTNVNGNVAGFWQAIPARYNLTTKKYPLILFIHGIGELGTSISRMNCCGLPRHLSTKTFPANFKVNNTNHSFIVMAPQFKKRPTAADMQSVIDYAKSRFRIDDTRIYVTGLSMGGGSTWDYSAVYGQNAAAIVPVCGGTRPTNTMAQQIASKNLGVWGVYSSKDAVVPVQWGYDFLSWIDNANAGNAGRTKLTVWTDVDHNGTWGRAFNPTTRVDGYNIYEWMLLFKKGTSSTPAPAPTPDPTPDPTPTPTPGNVAPVAIAGSDRSIPKSWNYLPELNANKSTDTDGWIAKFTWSKISGPSNPTITSLGAGRASLSSLVVGTYVFRVAVTDGDGAVSTDDIAITITNN